MKAVSLNFISFNLKVVHHTDSLSDCVLELRGSLTQCVCFGGCVLTSEPPEAAWFLTD